WLPGSFLCYLREERLQAPYALPAGHPLRLYGLLDLLVHRSDALQDPAGPDSPVALGRFPTAEEDVDRSHEHRLARKIGVLDAAVVGIRLGEVRPILRATLPIGVDGGSILVLAQGDVASPPGLGGFPELEPDGRRVRVDEERLPENDLRPPKVSSGQAIGTSSPDPP